MPNFVAIDFETADHGRDSACALGLTIVRDGEVIETITRLIRPPRQHFAFTHIHGLTWEDVVDAPDFAGVWTEVAPHVSGADFLVAHNASFDRGVLAACCEAHGLALPRQPFLCTVRMARAMWDLASARLPMVCDLLRIPLNHHEAGSDAEACARIALAGFRAGYAPPTAAV